jgi:hypothetical protein
VRRRIEKMVRVYEEKSTDMKVHLRIECFVSTCPFSKENEKDRTDLEAIYTPGHSFDESRVRIDATKLEGDLALSERKEIAMEVVPIEVLKRCVEACVSQRRGRNAGPEEIEIKSASVSVEPITGKDWGIVTTIRYKKEVTRVVQRA